MQTAAAGAAPRLIRRSYLKSGVLTAVYFLGGILASKGAVMGNLAPFGASLVAAAPKKRLLPSALGAAIGYIMLNPTDCFRYLAAVAAITVARWLLCDIAAINRSRLFAPLAAFIPVFATGVALLLGGASTMSAFSVCVTEAVLSGAAAFFFASALRLAVGRRRISSYTPQETACVVLTACIILLSLSSLEVEGISAGRILAVAAILLCARYGGVNGGAVCGVATGAVFSLSGSENAYICGSFAFGGLLGGLFMPLGKAACALAFVIADSVMSLALGSPQRLVSVLVEAAAGSAVFLVLPKDVGNLISPFFSFDSSETLADALKRNIVMRLSFASKAIANVKKDVSLVSQKLDVINSPTFEWVCENVSKSVCSGCGLKMYCYEHEAGVTRDDFFRLEQPLCENGRLTEEDVEKSFVKACCKKGEIARCMTESFRDYTASLEAAQRVADLRGVVAGQFSGVCDILSDLAADFENTVSCDEEACERITGCLEGLGIKVAECVCTVSQSGVTRVELELAEIDENKLSRSMLAREVSKCCGKRLDLPTVSREGRRIRAVMCETPVYDVEVGSHQHIARGGKLCGDCIDYFTDGLGSFHTLVCDGMGTGGRAAVDGNMAVSVMGRLLRSGLSADSALQILNSALMIKSEDESLSTVDLASVDLFSGTVTLKKAGAAMTYIKKGGRVTAKELPSLPAGILNNIRFSTDIFKLNTGDMLVMVSDGVVTDDEKWLEKLIKSWNRGSAQELAQAVVEEAIRRRAQSRDDDITAVAVRIVENE